MDNVSLNADTTSIQIYQKPNSIHQINKIQTSSEKNDAEKIIKAAKDLTLKEKDQVEKLKKIDKEVKSHEEAHRRTGGHLASFPRFTQVKGPDGNDYTVQGEVVLIKKEGNSPEETIAIAQTIKRAALAPQNPSQKDRQVALEAERMEEEAKQQIRDKRKKQYYDKALIVNGIIKERDHSINPEPSIKPTFKKVLGLSSAPPTIEKTEPLIQPRHTTLAEDKNKDLIDHHKFKSVDILA